MDGKTAAVLVNRERHYLNNILKDFTDEHSDFRPTEDMMTTAQQIKHIAQTTSWFMEGAFGAGFDMDFEAYLEEMKKPVTLEEAQRKLYATYDNFVEKLETMSEEELLAPMQDNQIFGNAPKMVVVTANSEHTAHHRGVLSVYLRLLGITPTMVYTE